MIPSAMSSALRGIWMQMQRIDRSAQVIARSGLDAPASVPTAPSEPPPSGPPVDALELEDALMRMHMAQRAVSAQLRVIEAANAMQQEAVHLGDRTTREARSGD